MRFVTIDVRNIDCVAKGQKEKFEFEPRMGKIRIREIVTLCSSGWK